MYRDLTSILCAVLLVFSCNEKQKTADSKPLNPVEYSMLNNADLFLEYPEINSISIGVYKDGKTYIDYYGTIDKRQNNAPNDQSLFELASVTKSFTGILAAQAVLDKKITVEDDIRMYLDGSYPNLEFNNRPIKIKDLLTHSSNIRRDLAKPLNKLFSLDATQGEKDAIKNYNRAALLNDLKTYTLDTLPGTKYNYSPVIGPELIALVLEKVYGKPYNELLETYVLNKANMQQTHLTLNASQIKNLVNGYNDDGQLIEPVFVPMTGAGASLKSTMPDLMKYVKYLLESDDPVIKEMQRPLFHDKEDDDWYGYFWILAEGFRHNGGTNGSTNWLIVSPEINAGFVVMFNSNGDVSGKLINSIAGKILDDLEHYPVKNAYYLVRKEILKNTDAGITYYKDLKKTRPLEFDFKDARMLNRIGYELLGEKKHNDAIKVFQLLVSEFPEEGNPYDSLGEAYFMNKQYDLSLKNYKKALELNPKNSNAEKMIETINDIILQD